MCCFGVDSSGLLIVKEASDEITRWLYSERGDYVSSFLHCLFGFQHLLWLFWRLACRSNRWYIVFRNTHIGICLQISPIRSWQPADRCLGITYKEWSKITSLKWSEIVKCTVCYRQSYGSGCLFYRVLDIILLSEAKRSKSISIRLSGKYCLNKNVINAIKQFGGSEVYDGQSSHAQNIYLGRIILFAIGLILLFALLSCNNRHDLTENYAVFTYGEGLYGESEEDYPIFVSKFG